MAEVSDDLNAQILNNPEAQAWIQEWMAEWAPRWEEIGYGGRIFVLGKLRGGLARLGLDPGERVGIRVQDGTPTLYNRRGPLMPLLAAAAVGTGGIALGAAAGGAGAAGATGGGAGAAGGGTAAGTAGAAGTSGAAAAGMSTLQKVMLGLGIGGTALSAIGQIKAGNAAKKLGDYNAKMAETMAEDALLRGDEDAARFKQGVDVLIGSQRAGFAGQNVDVGVGSAADVQADAAFLGELDAETIRRNARREAFGYRVQAENARLGGQQAQTESRFGAANTILGGTTSLLAARYGWGNA